MPEDSQPPSSSPPQRSSQRHALTFMGGTLGSRISGLLREVLLLSFFTETVTDAFRIAWTVPNLFRELLAEGALTNAFVPSYKELSRDEGKRLAGALFSILLLVNALLLALALWSAPWIVSLLLAAQPNVDYALALQLTRLIFPVLAAISFAALAMGILNAEEKFLAPAWAPVALNVVVIGFILAFPNQGGWLAIGVVLGGLAQFLIQIPVLIKTKLWPRLRWWHPSLLVVLMLMAPFAFTTGARQVLNVVAQRVVSNELFFLAGSVTAYFNANLILSMVLGLFSVSPALTFYSRLADEATRKPEAFRSTLLTGLRFISFLTIPAGLFMLVFAAPIMNTIFRLLPLAPGQDQTIVLSIQALWPLGLAALPLGLNALLIRPFYIRKHVRVPITISVIFISLNALLYWQLGRYYGLVGMSLATAVVAWLQCLTLIGWSWRDEKLDIQQLSGQLSKMLAAAALSITVAYAATIWLDFGISWFSQVLHVCTGGSVLLICYAGFSYLFNIPEMTMLSNRLRKR